MKLWLSVLLLDKGGLLCVELAELLFCIWRPLISSIDKSISGALCGALHINISPCVSLLIQLQCCTASHGQPILTVLRQLVVLSVPMLTVTLQWCSDCEEHFYSSLYLHLELPSIQVHLRPQTTILFPAPQQSEDEQSEDVSDVSNNRQRSTRARPQLHSDCRVKGGAVQRRRAAASSLNVTSVKDTEIRPSGTLAQVSSGQGWFISG